MKRLPFTLPRFVSHSFGTNGAREPPCTFDELASLMDPDPDKSTVWRKAVDREKKALLFYQLDLGGELPKFSKCVCIEPEAFRLNNHTKIQLIPSVFLDDDLVADTSVQTALTVAPVINSTMDVVRLLQYVELYPETPDDDPDCGNLENATHDNVVAPYINLANGARVEEEKHSEVENGCDDRLSVSSLYADSDVRPSATTTKNAPRRIVIKDASKPAPKRLPLPEPELNDAQIAYAKLVKHSLTQPGQRKEEIYPGAGLHAPTMLLKRIRDKYLKQCTKQNNDRVRILNSKGPGSIFAVELIDSLGKFTDRVHWNYTSQVFDEEYLTKIARFIDLNHPEILNGNRPLASVQDIRKAIRAKLQRYHHYREKRAKRLPVKTQKKQGLCSPERPKWKPDNPPVSDSALSVSLISPAENILWNPLLPFNHPEFRPSYLFPRLDYVPLIQDGNVPPIYVKNTWRDYFISAQSRVDYPKIKRWIRAIMYQIVDQQAIFHMCYLYKKAEDGEGPNYTFFHHFVSTGFVKTLEEFINYHTTSRELINRDTLTGILSKWFKENRLTVLKRNILNADPLSVNVHSKIVVGLRYKKIVGLK